jgi:hypothetical protein
MCGYLKRLHRFDNPADVHVGEAHDPKLQFLHLIGPLIPGGIGA